MASQPFAAAASISPSSFRPLQLARDQNPQAMKNAPDHKGPIGPMPDAGNKEGDEEIAICEKRSAPVSPQWDVNVIAKPA